MNRRAAPPDLLRAALRWFALWAVAAVVVGLAGCAATSITSQVENFGRWPEGRKPSTFVFDVLPSQQANPVSQDKLQAAALPALQALGFALLPPEQAANADVLVQLGLSVRVEPRLRYEPFGGFGPFPRGIQPYPYGPYGPYGHASFQWRAGLGGWGPGWFPSMEPPWVTMRVELILRDRASSKVLYEARASQDRVGVADPSVLPYLFQAALQSFPDAPPGPRVVEIPLPQEAR